MTHYITYFVKPRTATLYNMTMFRADSEYTTQVKPVGEGWYKITRLASPAELCSGSVEQGEVMPDISNLNDALAMSVAMEIARKYA